MTIESGGNILHKAPEKQEEEVSWACAHMCVSEHASREAGLHSHDGCAPRCLDSQSFIRTRGIVGVVAHSAETPAWTIQEPR